MVGEPFLCEFDVASQVSEFDGLSKHQFRIFQLAGTCSCFHGPILPRAGIEAVCRTRPSSDRFAVIALMAMGLARLTMFRPNL